VTGDHSIGRGAVGVHLPTAQRLLVGQQAELDERVLVEEQVQPLANSQLARSCCCLIFCSPPIARFFWRLAFSSEILAG